MLIKSPTDEDMTIIQRLNEMQDFRLHGIGNAIMDRIVFDGDKVIAYGILKNLAEAIFLVNPEVSVLKRAEAMRELLKYAEYAGRRAGCEQIHCFVKDEKLATTLKEKFGFVQTKDIVLVKGL